MSPASSPREPLVRGPLAGAGMLLASALLVYASFPPLDLGVLGYAALVPWLLWLRGRRARTAFAGSALLAVAHYGATLAWIAMLAWFGLAVLLVYLALYAGLFGVLHDRCRRSRIPGGPLAVALLFTALEYARARVLSGFPWPLLGHSQHDLLWVAQCADLGGVFLVSFLLAWTNAVIAEWIARRLEGGGSARLVHESVSCALVLGGAAVYGAVRLAAPADEPGPTLAAIQANIPMRLKHDGASREEILDRHVVLTREAVRGRDVDLVIWSETMFPYVWDHNDPRADRATRSYLGEVAREVAQAWFLTGVNVIGEGPRDPLATGYRQWNRAVLLDGKGRIRGSYDKRHLVPAGEYFPARRFIPFRRTFERMFHDAAGWYPTLTPGTSSPVLELETPAGTLPFGVLICYDSVFADVALDAAAGGARFLVNLSNDGWYGTSAELDQILAITRFRAIESRLPVFRATNTGISAVLDSRGRVVERLVGVDRSGRPAVKEARGTLVRRVGMGEGDSVYVRLRDAFALGCVVLAVLALVVPGRVLNGSD